MRMERGRGHCEEECTECTTPGGKRTKKKDMTADFNVLNVYCVHYMCLMVLTWLTAHKLFL